MTKLTLWCKLYAEISLKLKYASHSFVWNIFYVFKVLHIYWNFFFTLFHLLFLTISLEKHGYAYLFEPKYNFKI